VTTRAGHAEPAAMVVEASRGVETRARKQKRDLECRVPLLGFRVVATPDWLDFFIRVWAHSTLDARSSSADSICASSPAEDLQIVVF
jgi:hypothetical protein